MLPSLEAVAWLGDDPACRGTERFDFFSTHHLFILRDTHRLIFQRDHARVKSLSDRLIHKINLQVEHVVRNGDVYGYPGCVNLSFAYVEGESLLMALKVYFPLYQC